MSLFIALACFIISVLFFNDNVERGLISTAYFMMCYYSIALIAEFLLRCFCGFVSGIMVFNKKTTEKKDFESFLQVLTAFFYTPFAMLFGVGEILLAKAISDLDELNLLNNKLLYVYIISILTIYIMQKAISKFTNKCIKESGEKK